MNTTPESASVKLAAVIELDRLFTANLQMTVVNNIYGTGPILYQHMKESDESPLNFQSNLFAKVSIENDINLKVHSVFFD